MEILIFVRVKRLTPGDVQNVRQKSLLQPALFFIIANFRYSKAFYIAYNVCKGKEDLSTYEFARRLSLRQMTCWNFKTKIQHAIDEMNSLSENEKLSIQKISNKLNYQT